MVLGACGLLAACSGSSDPALTDDVERTCELLTIEKNLVLPPPAMGAVPRSISSSFGAGSEVAYDASLSIDPEHVGDLEQLAEEVDALDGVDVAEVVDQEAAYDELREILAESTVLDTVEAVDLPAIIHVDVTTDDALDALASWAAADVRIGEMGDMRDTAAAVFASIARSFGDELDELEGMTEGRLRAALEAIRAPEDPEVGEVAQTFAVISDFLAEHCDDT